MGLHNKYSTNHKRYNSTLRPSHAASNQSLNMMVMGSKINPAERSNVSMLDHLNNGNNRSGDLSVDDMINGILNKPQFGHSFYKSPSNEMLMKKIKFGNSNREKLLSFGANAQKIKDWVPSPSQYNLEIDWSNTLPKDSGKFKRKPKETFITTIFKNS